jgi:hypothetical protein
MLTKTGEQFKNNTNIWQTWIEHMRKSLALYFARSVFIFSFCNFYTFSWWFSTQPYDTWSSVITLPSNMVNTHCFGFSVVRPWHYIVILICWYRTIGILYIWVVTPHHNTHVIFPLVCVHFPSYIFYIHDRKPYSVWYAM